MTTRNYFEITDAEEELKELIKTGTDIESFIGWIKKWDAKIMPHLLGNIINRVYIKTLAKKKFSAFTTTPTDLYFSTESVVVENTTTFSECYNEQPITRTFQYYSSNDFANVVA